MLRRLSVSSPLRNPLSCWSAGAELKKLQSKSLGNPGHHSFSHFRPNVPTFDCRCGQDWGRGPNPAGSGRAEVLVIRRSLYSMFGSFRIPMPSVVTSLPYPLPRGFLAYPAPPKLFSQVSGIFRNGVGSVMTDPKTRGFQYRSPSTRSDFDQDPTPNRTGHTVTGLPRGA